MADTSVKEKFYSMLDKQVQLALDIDRWWKVVIKREIIITYKNNY